MKLGSFFKQPGDRKRYTIDYSDWLDSGETITDVVFSVIPSGELQVDASEIAPDGLSTVFFANFGEDGSSYKIETDITTSGGQIRQDEIIFSVRDT